MNITFKFCSNSTFLISLRRKSNIWIRLTAVINEVPSKWQVTELTEMSSRGMQFDSKQTKANRFTLSHYYITTGNPFTAHSLSVYCMFQYFDTVDL